MQDLICYKQMPLWTSETLPAMFREKHNTQSGTWAKLVVIKGNMTFSMLEENGDLIETYTFTPDNQPPFIEPQAWHKIASCSPDLECQLAFYCRPEDYTNKKYDMTKTHSEVVNAVSYLSPCKALDLGCGSGRNSLYLNKLGFDVTAYDKNSQGIANINEIIRSDNLQGITAREFNINQQAIEGQYGFILSTVVLMFLEAGRIPSLIENMQQCTEIGGYNLIVSAMSTDDFPCTVPFSFTFKHDELKNYYAGWEIVKYNQEVGELHKTDENGNRIKLRFATILAKKVA